MDQQLENCSGIRSCEMYSVEYYGYIYLYTPIILTGIVLNSFNLAILANTTFKGCGPTFTFLKAMSAADLMYCCLGCPVGITRCTEETHDWQFVSRQVYEIYIHHPIVNTFATASVWITTAVAVERYITVTKVSLARQICTKEYARIAIVIIYISALIIHIPYFFYRVVSDDDRREYTEFGESQGFGVYSWFRTIFAKYMPIVVVTIFNLLLLVYVCQTNRKRKSMVFPHSATQRRQQLQTKCTAMLLGITITFVICHMMEPFIHATIYTSLFGECSIFEYTYRNSVMVVNVLEAASFASNFIFYCAFNKDFLKGVKDCFECKRNPCGKGNMNAHDMQTNVSQINGHNKTMPVYTERTSVISRPVKLPKRPDTLGADKVEKRVEERIELCSVDFTSTIDKI